MSENKQRKGKFYSFVTVGALTERGGRVTSGGGGKICGLRVARVTDVVTYSDGSEAVIIDGAGFAAVMSDQPAALIGSRLSNGDLIISTPWEDQECGIFVHESKPIPGLFDPEWTPPPREAGSRFAVSGATTALGGVVRDVSSDLGSRRDAPQGGKDRRFCRVQGRHSRAYCDGYWHSGR